MAVFEGQVTPGGGAPYWVSDLTVPGGNGKLSGTLLFVTVGGVLVPIDLAAGVYLPTQTVVSDTNGVPVQTGDATNNSERVTVVGGAGVTQFQVDSAPYTRGVDGGIPPQYLVGSPPAVPLGAAGAARMTPDGLQFNAGPPRENVVQNWIALGSTAEIIVLDGAAAGVFHDLTGIWIYTTTAASRFTIFLRDILQGPVRFPVSLAPGGGQVNPLSRPFNSTIAGNVWTAQLTSNPAPDVVYVILQAEKRTANS